MDYRVVFKNGSQYKQTNFAFCFSLSYNDKQRNFILCFNLSYNDKQINFVCRLTACHHKQKHKATLFEKEFHQQAIQIYHHKFSLLALWLAFCASSHGHYSYVWA